jgi:hypothetical protein
MGDEGQKIKMTDGIDIYSIHIEDNIFNPY